MYLRSFVCALAVLLSALAPDARGQDPRKPQIELMRVGFVYPGNRNVREAEFKAGAWTPVYLEIKCGQQPLDNGVLTVEAVDADEVRSHYNVPLSPLSPGESRMVLSYIKPGSQTSEINAIISVNGRDVARYSETYSAMDLDQQLFLVLGKQAASLRAFLFKEYNRNLDPEEASLRDASPRRVTGLYGPEGVPFMPRLWFAYEPADLIIITTGDRDFLTALDADKVRKEALAEWVRRGGNLVVSVAANQDIVGKMDLFQSLMPVSIEGQTTLPRLTAVERWTTSDNAPLTLRTGVPVAKMTAKPGREPDFLIEDSKTLPLAARGSYGLGKVTVLAFDLDEAPFRTWSAGGQFWKKFLTAAGVPAARDQGNNAKIPGLQMRSHPGQNEEDLATSLNQSLEAFPDVPVISFGWVALFILIYILIVGPLDYLFLKKVVKRLELTWITFPAVVLTISVAAYFTAYWLKGNDQKINKVDFVDFDLHTKQMYGRTWFTIFSPRIQNYTVGIEPFGSRAGADPGGNAEPAVLTSWFGRPETNWGGQNRPRSQGFFRRAYDYTRDATAMEGVPIQVWSTKSFTSAWEVPVDAGKPQIEADLSAPAARPEAVTGTITNNTGVAIEHLEIFIGRGTAGKWYSLGKIVSGQTLRLDGTQIKNGVDMDSWLTHVPEGAAPVKVATSGQRPTVSNATNIKQLLFYEKLSSVRNTRRNNVLRGMDQSWRLERRGEALLFGTLARGDGVAEQVAASPSNLSKLWLGRLPGSGGTRPVVLGGMSQENYFRILAPVKEIDRQ